MLCFKPPEVGILKIIRVVVSDMCAPKCAFDRFLTKDLFSHAESSLLGWPPVSIAYGGTDWFIGAAGSQVLRR
jgi:hypothetical protein